MHEVTFSTEDKPKLLSQKQMPYALFSCKDRQGNSETES
ncbi:hypothetical protein ERO13_D12G166901v2 [Gossypium hirsutum]|nr:hypothetical protein ERO13_D12G166901v2 [Gossypium hirsutum]